MLFSIWGWSFYKRRNSGKTRLLFFACGTKRRWLSLSWPSGLPFFWSGIPCLTSCFLVSTFTGCSGLLSFLAPSPPIITRLTLSYGGRKWVNERTCEALGPRRLLLCSLSVLCKIARTIG